MALALKWPKADLDITYPYVILLHLFRPFTSISQMCDFANCDPDHNPRSDAETNSRCCTMYHQTQRGYNYSTRSLDTAQRIDKHGQMV